MFLPSYLKYTLGIEKVEQREIKVMQKYKIIGHTVWRCELRILQLGKGIPAVIEVNKSLSCQEKARREQLIIAFLTRENEKHHNDLSGCKFNINKRWYFFTWHMVTLRSYLPCSNGRCKFAWVLISWYLEIMLSLDTKYVVTYLAKAAWLAPTFCFSQAGCCWRKVTEAGRLLAALLLSLIVMISGGTWKGPPKAWHLNDFPISVSKGQRSSQLGG